MKKSKEKIVTFKVNKDYFVFDGSRNEHYVIAFVTDLVKEKKAATFLIEKEGRFERFPFVGNKLKMPDHCVFGEL